MLLLGRMELLVEWVQEKGNVFIYASLDEISSTVANCESLVGAYGTIITKSFEWFDLIVY